MLTSMESIKGRQVKTGPQQMYFLPLLRVAELGHLVKELRQKLKVPSDLLWLHQGLRVHLNLPKRRFSLLQSKLVTERVKARIPS